jgi:hypothetical protein
MPNIFNMSVSSFSSATRRDLNALASAFFAAMTAAAMVGCASPSGQAGSAASAGAGGPDRTCNTSDNLLIDTSFTRTGEFARVWRQAQHTGEPSFSTEVTDGVLEIRRIATQPWMLFRQTVADPRLSGATIRYSAELKGDLPVEPRLHGFDHVGGLYLKIGRGAAQLAEHQPNHDQWDWQTFSHEVAIPEGETSLRAGFVHQSGGALWAKNPSLVILDCS